MSKAGKSLENTDSIVWKEERARLLKNNLTLNLTTTGFVFTYSLKVRINKTDLLALIMDFSIRVLLRMNGHVYSGVLIAVVSLSVQS